MAVLGTRFWFGYSCESGCSLAEAHRVRERQHLGYKSEHYFSYTGLLLTLCLEAC